MGSTMRKKMACSCAAILPMVLWLPFLPLIQADREFPGNNNNSLLVRTQTSTITREGQLHVPHLHDLLEIPLGLSGRQIPVTVKRFVNCLLAISFSGKSIRFRADLTCEGFLIDWSIIVCFKKAKEKGFRKLCMRKLIYNNVKSRLFSSGCKAKPKTRLKLSLIPQLQFFLVHRSVHFLRERPEKNTYKNIYINQLWSLYPALDKSVILTFSPGTPTPPEAPVGPTRPCRLKPKQITHVANQVHRLSVICVNLLYP